MMKNRFLDEEVYNLKAGCFLLWEGINMVQKTMYSVLERTDYEVDTSDFDELVKKTEDQIFELSQKIPKHDFFKDYSLYSKTRIVHLLSSATLEMFEMDEVYMTFTEIQKVLSNNLTKKDKDEINEALNSIEDGRFAKEMEEFIFTKDFLKSSYFKR